MYGPSRLFDAEKRMAWISFQLLLALDYLHDQGIAHRDLKLENVLVEDHTAFSRILLADFGMAKRSGLQSSDLVVEASDKIVQTRMRSYVGTVSYQAPELAKSKSASHKSTNCEFVGYDSRIDIWKVWQTVLCETTDQSGALVA